MDNFHHSHIECKTDEFELCGKGEPNSLVKIKVKRSTEHGLLDMDITLIREIGNEHDLKQKHQGLSFLHLLASTIARTHQT